MPRTLTATLAGIVLLLAACTSGSAVGTRPETLLAATEAVDDALPGSWELSESFAPALNSAGAKWTSGKRQLWQEVRYYSTGAEAHSVFDDESPKNARDYIGVLEELDSPPTGLDEILYACAVKISKGCLEWVTWGRADRCLIKITYNPAQFVAEEEYRRIVEEMISLMPPRVGNGVTANGAMGPTVSLG